MATFFQLLRWPYSFAAGIVQSVLQLATALEVFRTNPGAVEIFRTRPDRHRGPPSLMYNGSLLR
jgi:hypothetical protein